MINLLLYIHRRKLEKMIESQILDKYVNKKMKKMLYEGSSSLENI